jgi:hypothetical protein
MAVALHTQNARQEDFKVKASLSYIARHCLKKPGKKRNNNEI